VAKYHSLGHLLTHLTDAFQPPERLTVSQAAAKYRFVNNPGSYVGPWLNETAPYLVEVMDCFTDRRFASVVFAAPAQCGKTDAFINWLLYSVICDPMDMILYQTSQVSARDFSRRRVDRLHRHTPSVGERLLAGNSGDNVFDKQYRNGMMLSLSWPSINELSGRPVGRVFLTDYDRMPQDVDGEGSPYDLAHKRTTTFRSARKTVVESSPGFVVEDPRWIRSTPHEAPPCPGILALYNRGDRRRWQWQCQHCAEWFEPAFSLLQIPDSADVVEASHGAMMMCPHCSGLHGSEQKHALNMTGKWVKDGQTLDKKGLPDSPGTSSTIASFWLKGPAAAFAPWHSLVSNYILAEREYQRTGSQEALKATVNTDQGEPYVVRGATNDRTPDDLKANATGNPEREVPTDARFLIATADVQRSKFVVQVFAVAPAADNQYDLHVVDRFDIVKSNRRDADGDREWVKPHAYLEDWFLLKEKVLDAEYALQGQEGSMRIKFMVCDSGGTDGVTHNAYAFWARLRAAGGGDHKRFVLCKGERNLSAPRVQVSYPDNSSKSARSANAAGQIPVLMFNVNMLKDKVDSMVGVEQGAGAILIPAWMPDEVFSEMTVEVRTPKGWENKSRKRNEAWDLCTYAVGVCHHLGVERFDWKKPPSWAAPWKDNLLVRLDSPQPETGEPKPFANQNKDMQDLARLAAILG
jgi:phage terminase large subunit GpA-like protein